MFAAFREQQKNAKHGSVEPQYLFVPLLQRRWDLWGKNAPHFLNDLSSRLIESTKDRRLASVLFQGFNVAL